jgi:hypothetical protein
MIESNSPIIDEALNSKYITRKTKIFLLLTLCDLSRLFSEDLSKKYLKELDQIKSEIPQEFYKQYRMLHPVSASVKTENVKESGFISDIKKEIIAAAQKYDTDEDTALAELNRLEKKIKKSWWRSNRLSAWFELINAWLPVDRKKSIKLLLNINPQSRIDYLKNLNKSNPLIPDEWDTIFELHHKSVNLISLIEYFLNDEETLEYIPTDLAMDFANKIISRLTAYKEELDEKKSDKNISKYFQLVKIFSKSNPELAEKLIVKLYKSFTNDKQSLKLNFTYTFRKVQSIVIEWIKISADHEKSAEIIKNQSPEYIKDFALAQWYGILSFDQEKAASNYENLVSKVNQKEESERWFFILLVVNEFYDKAIELVQKSHFKNNLIPEMNRALIYHFPEKARQLLSLPNKEADPVGYFILLPSNQGRIEFLKNNQNGIFSKSLWKKPCYVDIATTGNNQCLYTYYSKNVEPIKMFNEYLVTAGYKRFDHYKFDAYLQTTLKSWVETDPIAASDFINGMWNSMIPQETELRFDLFRGSIFERCRNVFGAHPETLFNFLNWIKRKMVDQTYSYTEGNMVYSLNLKLQTLYYFALIAAETVGKISAKCCDDILVKATIAYAKNVEDDKEFIKMAAQLYASEKGIKSFSDELKFPDRVTEIWQLGIIESSKQQLLQELVLSVEQNKSAEENPQPSNEYTKYDQSGICDVCNKSIEPNEAFLVPVNEFYASQKYLDWLSHGPLSSIIQLSGGIDEYLKVSLESDKTAFSAVCPKCIHMFKDK